MPISGLGRILAILTVSGCLLGLAGGCAASMKAMDCPGQTLLRKGSAAMIEQEGVGVVVTPAAVPFEENDDLTAVTIDVVNQSDRPVRLALQDIVFVGADGMRHSAIDPRRFERYARMSQGGVPPVYDYRPARVYVGVGYGGWHYPCGRYDVYDPWWYDYYWDDYYGAVQEYYYRRERMARFATSLWRTRRVEPGYVAGGHVVFEYRLRRKEVVGVEVTLQRMPSTQPALVSSRPTLEPATAGPVQMRFFFKT
jgi:hypothetical protein